MNSPIRDIIEYSFKVSFRHAVELLRADHPSLAGPGKFVHKATTAAVKLETPFDTSAEDQQVLGQVVDYYHETLKQSPEALRYLQSRGLEHPEMVAHFRLGIPGTGYSIPDFVDGPVSRAHL